MVIVRFFRADAVSIVAEIHPLHSHRIDHETGEFAALPIQVRYISPIERIAGCIVGDGSSVVIGQQVTPLGVPVGVGRFFNNRTRPVVACLALDISGMIVGVTNVLK